MKVTPTKLRSLITLIGLTPYDYFHKEEYRRLGRSILRQLAKDMGLQKGEFDIRWNPGGVAVSGDHTLHTDKIYVAFHDNLNLGWFYWRKCHGRKDYGCGMDCPNQIVQWNSLLADGGWDKFVVALIAAQRA